MALFGISDLHLSFEKDKPMDVFRGWENYTVRLEENWRKTVKEDDVVVLPGDFSWALKLCETKPDFLFLENLPGKKILLKGNHDLWWSTAKKIKEFFIKENIKSVDIVFNNCYEVGDYAICGTRGWIKEKAEEEKIVLREAARLETSIKSALQLGKKPIVFLHYPPVYADGVSGEIIEVLKKYSIDTVYHGHIHGAKRNFTQKYEGISFVLLSCDAINFTPFPIF